MSAAEPDIDALERQASALPVMNPAKVGACLRRLAREAAPNTSIVEVGTWLGSGTAHLALGNLERQQPLPIHSFDRFQAVRGEVIKAGRAGVELTEGQDTKAWVGDQLAPFGPDIHLHKGDLLQVAWTKGPIGLYVDDAAKSPTLFLHVLEAFAPAWVPGHTILVLQDYHFWKVMKKARGRRRYAIQKRIIEGNPECFSPLDLAEFEGTPSAAFRYEAPLKIPFLRWGNKIRRAFRT